MSPAAELCRVTGFKRVAETAWEPMMRLHGAEVPLCWHHFRLRLWWHRGWVSCRDEEPE